MMSQENHPLTPLQKGMLFQYLTAPSDGIYIMQSVCTLHEQINTEQLRAAWAAVADRFTALRIAFQTKGIAEPSQFAQDSASVPFEVYDWRSKGSGQRESDLAELLESDLRLGFDLESAPLLRVALVLTGDAESTLIFTNHHMILDGMSRFTVLEEVFKAYDAGDTEGSSQKTEQRSFLDYARWSSESDPASSEWFWRELLAGFATPTNFTAALRAPDGHPKGYRYEYHQEVLAESVTTRLREIALHNGARLNTLIQLAWGVLLARYTGESDVVFGVTRAGRGSDFFGDKDLVGLFMNTLPVRIQFPNGAFLSDLLPMLRTQQLAIGKNESTPLIAIQQWAEIPQGSPLFDSIVVFNPTNPTDSLKRVGFDGSRRSLDVFGFTQFPVTLEVFAGPQLELRVSGDRTVLDEAALTRLAEHLRIILESVAEDPRQPICDIPMLPSAEYDRLVVGWNDTGIAFDKLAPVHQVFERQVAAIPRKTAVVWGETTLDYHELNRRANFVATELAARGVAADEPVAICMPRSIEIPIAVLAVLKAGGAYVPLDPNYPTKRLEYMLDNSNARVLLTHSRAPKLSDYTGTAINVDEIDWEATRDDIANPEIGVNDDNLAYVIYTSGSTGKPKGVEMRHGPLANLIRWQWQQERFSGPMNCLQFTSLSFDVSFQELFSTWASGGCLIMVSEETRRDPRALVTFIAENRVQRIFLPFIALQGLAEAANARPELEFQLNDVITAGEQLIVTDAVRTFFTRLGGCALHNQYGPSETHVVTALTLDGSPQDWPRSPSIGRPIANCSIFLLDSNMRPVPTGVMGELYIGGDCLARGYHNRPDLTEERFVQNPLPEADGQRLYRSGDLARYLHDGEIEFLGRADEQVKIRGFRVELGEIEAVLERHEAIGQCAVIMREHQPGNKRLVAYVVPRERENDISGEREGAFPVGEVRDSLRSQLPEYMIPAAFVILDALPLTPSGKLNRRALPEPCYSPEETRGSVVGPRDSTEAQLVAIWEEVLGVSPIGITEDFFELGGHSLTAVELMIRIQEVFGVDLDLNALWSEATTIETHARRLRD